MRTTITRKITQTKIHACKVTFVDGAPTTEPLEPITVYGNVTKDTAKKAVARAYGKDENVVVAKIETEEKQFEISVSDFVKYAKIVDATEQTETNAI